MRRIKFLIMALALLAVTGSSSNIAIGSGVPPISIQANGETVVLEPGKNVHPQTYTLLRQDGDFASRMDWVFMDGKWIPLSRGVAEPVVAEDSLPLSGPEHTPQSASCTITLNVPVYNQCASPWGSNRLFNDPGCQTMCQAGCAITSATMVFRYYGAGKDPGQVNTCCRQHNCRSGCRLVWGCAADNCSDNKAAFVNYHDPFNWGLLCGLLSQGRPPIVRLVKGSNTHFVVVYRSQGGGSDPNNYYINDPADGSTYKRLSHYTANGWSPSRVAEYRRR